MDQCVKGKWLMIQNAFTSWFLLSSSFFFSSSIPPPKAYAIEPLNVTLNFNFHAPFNPCIQCFFVFLAREIVWSKWVKEAWIPVGLGWHFDFILKFLNQRQPSFTCWGSNIDNCLYILYVLCCTQACSKRLILIDQFWSVQTMC